VEHLDGGALPARWDPGSAKISRAQRKGKKAAHRNDGGEPAREGVQFKRIAIGRGPPPGCARRNRTCGARRNGEDAIASVCMARVMVTISCASRPERSPRGHFWVSAVDWASRLSPSEVIFRVQSGRRSPRGIPCARACPCLATLMRALADGGCEPRFSATSPRMIRHLRSMNHQGAELGDAQVQRPVAAHLGADDRMTTGTASSTSRAQRLSAFCLVFVLLIISISKHNGARGGPVKTTGGGAPGCAIAGVRGPEEYIHGGHR